jgi:hypothetical protein
MHTQAVIFASRVTGVIGVAASLFLWKVAGLTGLILGLIGSAFWFWLAFYINRKENDTSK